MNSKASAQGTNNAQEVTELLDAVKALIIPHIRSADADSVRKATSAHDGLSMSNSNGATPSLSGAGSSSRPNLVDTKTPEELKSILQLDLPDVGTGKDGLVEMVEKVLEWSVNTWDQGFLDKLYASTNAVGVVSELILAVLNTNVHVYQVSPVLTLIEKHTARRLAEMYGFTGPNAGGMVQPGGSAGNCTSIIIARNTLYPETKTKGLQAVGKRFTLFTSKHGHYSLEKAAQMYGYGSEAIVPVPIDEAGRMIPSELDRLVRESKERGETPFYVNATAGTTVLGSYDPFEEIADICGKHGLWMHVDGSWGGSVVFNKELAATRLKGVERANSVVMSPHKMLNVPVTCSFLLGKDIRQFWKALTLPAGYLFHNESLDSDSFDIYDLADLTPQCGRKGDAFKLFLAWGYYGTEGFSQKIGRAFALADRLLVQLEKSRDFVVVSKRPLPCLQVCFYYAPDGALPDANTTSARTAEMTARLIRRGWMVDFAPGDRGKFFRVVINLGTLEGTVDGLFAAFETVGKEVVAEGL